MRDVSWYDVERFCKKQIEYHESRCVDVDIDDRERLINAVELRTYKRIINLQRQEAGIDE